MNWLRKLMKGLARGFADLSPNCKAATRLQSEAMDRSLSSVEKAGLRLHLFLCKRCGRYGEQLKLLHSSARQCEDHKSPELAEKLSAEARERIKHRLRSGS